MIVHIGTPKTGTTTIQQFLTDNTRLLRKQGFLYPKDRPRSISHVTLWEAFLNLEERKPSPAWQLRWEPLESLSDEERFAAVPLCERQIARHSTNETVLLSCEGFSTCSESEIHSFKQWLTALFDHVTIVVYLRRQPEYLVSLFAQQVKVGSVHCGFEQFLTDFLWGNPVYAADDYQRMLSRWSGTFGKENIIVKIFDRKEMVRNDLVDDFCNAAGINLQCLQRPKPLNESCDAETTEFLRLLNPVLPRFKEGTWNGSRGFLPSLAEKHLGSGGNAGYRLTRAEAQAILDRYRESNNAVAREYLNREQLFSEDVSKYPVECQPHHLTVEKCADIFAELWTALIEKMTADRKERRKISRRLKRLGEKIVKFPQRCVRAVNELTGKRKAG